MYPEGSAYTIPPELSEYEQHLVKLWREVGSISQSGMGVAPLVWEQVIMWAERFYSQQYVQYVDKVITTQTAKRTKTITEKTPIILTQCMLLDCELEMIMQLSREYCDEYHSASDKHRPCPIEIFEDEVDKELESQALFQGLKDLGFTFV